MIPIISHMDSIVCWSCDFDLHITKPFRSNKIHSAFSHHGYGNGFIHLPRLDIIFYMTSSAVGFASQQISGKELQAPRRLLKYNFHSLFVRFLFYFFGDPNIIFFQTYMYTYINSIYNSRGQANDNYPSPGKQFVNRSIVSLFFFFSCASAAAVTAIVERLFTAHFLLVEFCEHVIHFW